MKFKKLLSAALITSSMLLAGCASIVSESAYPVTIDSQPQGVAFEILNKGGNRIATGKTPDVVVLEAGDGTYFGRERYTINYKGSKPYTVVLEPSLDGWYIGNLGFGGLIGWLIVDPLTGAMWKLPKQVKADLNASLQISLREYKDLTEEEKKNLVALIPAER